ncbi:acyl-CoA thioester hydrolase [Dysgonomonas hofstadii]|uniref:Acyl-CoA thioester hydrolase n=1 Tax=Dysgonomonas hofstadii TaxID=637886 RepID=A0A840CSM2_9BACT|nr:acyl-CoA thioesterase [Dysgonomonas hofstadii]MBB4036654.1 acyl-CoA thioester hydrolase [Dysgonomonas hofstadii]
MALTFENKMKVRDYECDSQGVVNNAIYLHYFEATRHELMEKCGLRLRDLTKGNIIPVVRNVNISYRNSLRGSEEFICTATAVRDGVRYYFHQEITRISDNTLCAKAVIEVVCLINGKVTAPDMFDKAFIDYLEWK